MRGIPQTLKTREDVYNVAMDLPPDRAAEFLDALTPDKVRGLLSAEELYLLKGRVADARFKQQRAADRVLALEARRQGLKMDIEADRRTAAETVRTVVGLAAEIAAAATEADRIRAAIEAARTDDEKAADRLRIRIAAMEDVRDGLVRRLVQINRDIAGRKRTAADLAEKIEADGGAKKRRIRQQLGGKLGAWIRAAAALAEARRKKLAKLGQAQARIANQRRQLAEVAAQLKALQG